MPPITPVLANQMRSNDNTLMIMRLAGEFEKADGDRGTLSGPMPVVKIVEAARKALIENVGASEGEGSIVAEAEA